MSIPGYATPEATAAYAAKFSASLPPAAYRPLPASEWTASRLGFGTYR